MPATARAVAAGPDALAALGAAVDAARQAGTTDALPPPVTVLVPRSYVGLAVRRWLAGRPGGVVDLRVTTVERLGADLAGATVAAAGRLPLTDAVLQAALRRALADDPGVLAEHRDHPATLDALVTAWRDLRTAPARVRRALAATGPRAATVVGIVDRAEVALAAYADELDLLRAATALVRDEPACTEPLGAVVVHLLAEPAPAAVELLAALGTARPTTVVVSLVGDASADRPLLAVAGQLTGAAVAAPEVAAPTGTRARSAPNPDTEVLACLRDVLAQAAAGVPLHRMGIAHAVPAPYASLVHEQLELAGIPCIGTVGRTLAQTAAGRLLLGALELPALEWRRDALIGWLAGAPVHHDGRPVPATAWDRRSCDAGIVGGRDAWASGLEHLLRRLDHEIDAARRGVDDDRRRGAPGLDTLEAHRASAAELARFVADLGDRLDALARLERWDALAAATTALLRDLVGGAGAIAAWPDVEQEALLAVEAALGTLASLDAIDPGPGLDGFATALRAELARPAPQIGRFGDGVVVGPIPTLAGLDLDVVWVLGLHDGGYPTSPRRDALLPEEERMAAGGDLATTDRRTADQRRAYLAALAAAPHRTCSFSRGELRRGRELRPSRWLLDTIGTLAGHDGPLYARDLDRLGPVDGLEVLGSHVATVAAPGAPVDPDDARVRGLLRWTEAGHRVRTHWLATEDAPLHRALEAIGRRLDPRPGRFDGLVDPDDLDGARAALLELPVSPTRLETYATCGRRYLLGRVLGLAAPDRPEDVVEMAELQRGRLVHEVLERFLEGELAAAPDGIAPGRRWDADAHARLEAVAEEVCASFERRGVTGNPHLWQLDRRALLRNLHRLLELDDAHRAERGAVPVAAELAFGDIAPVELRTPSGRRLPLHGSVDRVDRTTGGGAIVVDYKHAKRANYRIAEGIAQGRHLQLPVYGLAARQVLGVDEVAVGYWITRTPLQPPELVDLEPLLDEAAGAVDVLVDHIEAGAFPARPGREGWRGHDHCRYCDFDALCPTSRGDDWERARALPELAALVALVDPDEAEAEAAATRVGGEDG